MFKIKNNQKKRQKGFIQHLFSFSKKKKGAGFTLVEVIVAVGIFSLVMMISIGAVLSIVGANKKAQSLHNVINNFNLAIESMIRDMRTGYNYQCDGVSNNDCEDADSFTFDSTQSGSGVQEITYSLEGPVDNAYITKRIGTSGDDVRLTSEEVKVIKLAFYVRGSTPGDTVQPLVLVVIEGEATINGQISRFNLQTLVSQRNIDI